MKITCSKCSYSWETKTKMKYVTCPSCQLKIKVIKKEENGNPPRTN